MKLIADKNDSEKNIGLAYVTFETSEAAQLCVETINRIDNRPVNASLAKEKSMSRQQSSSSSMIRKESQSASRYYNLADEKRQEMIKKLKLLATKCNNCGEPGHLQAGCPHSKKMEPCPLFAEDDGHSMHKCKYAIFLF